MLVFLNLLPKGVDICLCREHTIEHFTRMRNSERVERVILEQYEVLVFHADQGLVIVDISNHSLFVFQILNLLNRSLYHSAGMFDRSIVYQVRS